MWKKWRYLFYIATFYFEEKGLLVIIYNSSRNTGSTNNRAVVLFGDRYDPAKIKPVLDKPILTK